VEPQPGNVQAATADAVRAKEDARRVRRNLRICAGGGEEYLTAQMQVERYTDRATAESAASL